MNCSCYQPSKGVVSVTNVLASPKTLRMLLLVHAKWPLFNDVTVYEFLSITWFSRKVEPFKTTTTF